MLKILNHVFWRGVNLSDIQARHPSISIENRVFNIAYRHSRRAKRLSMRMSTDYQNVSITVPTACTQHEIERFLAQCTQWLVRRKLKWSSRDVLHIPFKDGAEIPILGRTNTLAFDESGDFDKFTLQNDTLMIPKKIDHPRIIQAFLNEQLLEYVSEKSKAYADILRVNFNTISIKPLKSSYGICSSKKNISYASRLVFAPLDVIDYVCAHEVAHLKEMNHSAAFWKTVKELMPDYESHKAWLKTHGYTLQRYGGGNRTLASSF